MREKTDNTALAHCDAPNPLNSVEEILADNDWLFTRMTERELMVQITGKGCDYRMFFIWQDDLKALQFCCQYDLTIKDQNLQTASKVLMSVNEKLWMGHFDLPQDTSTPSFRYTCFLRGMNETATEEQIDDLVTLGLAQCERFYPVFQIMSQSEKADDQILALALMDTVGES